MQESTTYQAILREGRQEGLVEGRQEGLVEGRNEGLIEGRITGERQLLIRQGTKKFGNPDIAILDAIEAIRDVERLEALGERMLTRTCTTGVLCFGHLIVRLYSGECECRYSAHGTSHANLDHRKQRRLQPGRPETHGVRPAIAA